MSASGLHGQKKSAALSSEAQAQKVERERRKIDAYKALWADIQDRRSRSDWSHEALDATTTLLTQNPEFYTVWNYRREILVGMRPSMDTDAVQAICDAELKLVEELLRAVPKSYWVWNHRRWILEHHMPRPEWARELKLLNYMLDLDARNFHGWDYRRYVIGAIKTRSPLQEFEYTTTKINQNFSNFSAWHYRSKLMPFAFPAQAERDAAVTSDLELVRNAIFTEPADQSAWLYQRWLLGQVWQPVELVGAYAVMTTDEDTNGSHGQLLALAFNQDVRLGDTDAALSVRVDGQPHQTATALSPAFGNVHLFALDLAAPMAGTPTRLEVVLGAGRFVGSQPGLVSSETTVSGTAATAAERIVHLHVVVNDGQGQPKPIGHEQPESVWQEELASVQELAEVEPDSKWPLLTLVYMYRHDGLAKNADAAIAVLDHLQKIDPLRRDCYLDMRSSFVWAARTQPQAISATMDLSRSGLTTIPDVAPLLFVVELDLSGNGLRDMRFARFLVSAQTLCLDDNAIEAVDVDLGHLGQLRTLSLKRNRIVDGDAVAQRLRAQLPRLAVAMGSR